MLFEQSINLIKGNFYFSWFALLLFVAGFTFSAVVERTPGLNFVKAFPVWFVRFTMRFANPKRNFWQIFLFIALFNSSAIFFYMMSGVFVVLPFAIAFLTGLNIGVIMQEPIPEEFKRDDPFEQESAGFSFYSIFGAILVPLFELFIFCAFVGIGMSMGVGIAMSYSPFMIAVLVKERALSYFLIGIPTLIVSALLEAAAIKDLE